MIGWLRDAFSRRPVVVPNYLLTILWMVAGSWIVLLVEKYA